MSLRWVGVERVGGLELIRVLRSVFGCLSVKKTI